ncbi:hypothetical protein [Qipengyuania sp. MTN3-11]|uniref:hypothetical protein n=1 Tax=Qipengyuania sp. MTN3-11 TaxID=3056557 RepID=UPI0036F304B7
MNLSPSIANSSDFLSLSPGLDGGKGQKSAGSALADGFADLLDSLSQITPLPKVEGVVGEAADAPMIARQVFELPTGKFLPDALPKGRIAGLAPTDLGSEAKTEENSQGIQRAPEEIAALVMPLVAPTLTEASISFTPSIPNASTPGLVAPLASTMLSAVTVESTANDTTGSTNTSAPADPFGAKPVRALSTLSAEAKAGLSSASASISTSVATATSSTNASIPFGTTSAAATPSSVLPNMPQVQSAPAVTTAATQSIAIPVQLAASSAMIVEPASVAGKEATTAAVTSTVAVPKTATASGRSDALATPALAEALAATESSGGEAAAEHHDTGTTSGSDKQQFALRGAHVSEIAKAQAPTLAPQSEPTGDTPRPVAATARPVVNDPFADVERVVEQLTAARHVDLSKPAAIAVAHREFGALTVAFDHSSDGIKAEISAETSEAQRALAAAMANEKGASRSHETSAPAHPSQTQHAPTGSDRGGLGGQAGSSLGQGGNGDQRSPSSDPRSQREERAAQHHKQAPKSASDDALYA